MKRANHYPTAESLPRKSLGVVDNSSPVGIGIIAIEMLKSSRIYDS
jgi:hypothetical protein